MFEMTQAGSGCFPGCLGSTDATHVSIERCFNRLRNQHISSKLPCTARTYNATVKDCTIVKLKESSRISKRATEHHMFMTAATAAEQY